MKKYNEKKPINVAGGKIITIKNLALKLAKIINYKGELNFNNNYPDGMLKKYFDSSMIKKLGWKPHLNLDEGLKLTYEWFKKTYNMKFSHPLMENNIDKDDLDILIRYLKKPNSRLTQGQML